MLRNLNIFTLDKNYKGNVEWMKSNKRARTYNTKTMYL